MSSGASTFPELIQHTNDDEIQGTETNPKPQSNLAMDSKKRLHSDILLDIDAGESRPEKQARFKESFEILRSVDYRGRSPCIENELEQSTIKTKTDTARSSLPTPPPEENSLALKRRDCSTSASLPKQTTKVPAMSRAKSGLIRVNKYATSHSEPAIYFHRIFAKKLKLHQIEGIQFLWRQIIGTKRPKGALLAHTMGLGKTVQVIAFLFTVGQVRNSQSPDVQNCLTKQLQTNRTLILMPAGLLINWKEEFVAWSGMFPVEEQKCWGKVWTIDVTLDIDERLRTLNLWAVQGGILLLGYGIFREYITTTITSSTTTQLTKDEEEIIEKALIFPGPTLVIADEAHAFKNTSAKLSKAALLISTNSRIALTGSPLSNNLTEYLTLINWIRPGKIGEPSAFRSEHITPIQNGMNEFGEFTMLKSDAAVAHLRYLSKTLKNTVHRRNAATINKALKRKTEFLIRVPLTELQLRIYEAFISKERVDFATLTETHESSKNVPQNDKPEPDRSSTGTADIKGSLFKGLPLLRALCNHPEAFKGLYDKIRSRVKACSSSTPMTESKSASQKGITNTGSEKSPKTAYSKQEVQNNKPQPAADIRVGAAAGPYSTRSSSTTKEYKDHGDDSDLWLKDIYKDFTDITSITHSNKMLALVSILKESKSQGDPVLLFTHNIASLNYLEYVAKSNNLTICRLDGSVHFHTRRENLECFNRGLHDIYLVSTKAGGVGLNMQVANRVIILDNDFSPMWEQQAIGRSYRMGQKKEVYVYHFIAEGSIETKLMRMKHKKIRLADILVDQNWEQRKIVEDPNDLKKYLDPPVQMPVPSKPGGNFHGHDKLLDKVANSCSSITSITVVSSNVVEIKEPSKEDYSDSDTGSE